ncbi:Protein KIBRA [Hypsibius exemplaris]|uniref:Protein KIBRA n=1 Tax=Hypsibius exemplaris TaxID=2072580 RepID=A0A1W0WSP3_HYPEX|nr:Protein KIBRA [Hypsibius exemplaris]
MVDSAEAISDDYSDLPEGWVVAQDVDGKIFFVDHTNKLTTWVDPRQRVAQPTAFSDCAGDELPTGWERAYDPKVGIYFINHNTKTNHMEDPREKWKTMQEEMLKDYLHTAQDDLDAKREIYGVKEQRLRLAQDDFDQLNQRLDHFGGSKQSLCSNTSNYARYDVDLLKADVALAKSRVTRLQRELRQIDTEVRLKQRGLQSLTQVEQRFQETQGAYSIVEAQALLAELQRIQYSLSCGEKEKQELIHSLAQLKDDILSNRDQQQQQHQHGSSPDNSYLCLPQERFCAASQTDISGDLGSSSGVRIADLARRRLEYDETRQEVSDLRHRLAQVQNQMVPGQADADYDRILLIQEKEQLLHELCSLHASSRSVEQARVIQQEILKLEHDFRGKKDSSERSLAMRFKLQEEKTNLIAQLRGVMNRQASLESALRSLSTSTLSISSSRGSLNGSLLSIDCSLGGSGSSLDIASDGSGYQSGANKSGVNMQELHKRVERLLQQSGSLQSPSSSSSFSSLAATTSQDDSVGRWSNSQIVSRNRNLPGEVSARLLGAAAGGGLSSSFSSMASPDGAFPSQLPSYDQAFLEHQRRLTSRNYVTDRQQQQHSLGAVNQDNQDKSSLSSPTAASASRPEGIASYLSPSQLTRYPVDTISSSLGSQLLYDTSLSASARFPGDHLPPLTAISEGAMGTDTTTTATRPLRNLSLQSVAGDSGVDDSDCITAADFHRQTVTAQVQLRFWYNKRDLVLNVGIEQLSNVFCLCSSPNVQVSIRMGLVPAEGGAVGDVSTQRLPVTDNCLAFSDVFQFHLHRNIISTKTLQLNVLAFRHTSDLSGECLGTSLVSLADYSETSWFTKWVNVVRQTPAPPLQPRTQLSSQERMSAPLVSSIKPICASRSPFIANLLASSRVIECDVDDNDNGDGGKSESDCVSVIIRDESSDDSTIASTSQASTLTRGQQFIGDFDEFDEEDEFHTEENSEDDENGDALRDSPSSVVSVAEYPSSSLDAESGYGHSGDTLAELCDKETNTDMAGSLSGSMSSLSVKPNAGSSRRGLTGNHSLDTDSFARYSCRLNRSDSDSCVPHQRQVSGDTINFARAALDRRSLRRPATSKNVRPVHQLVKHQPINVKTGLDLELDLKASQVKLQNLNDEVSRLRSLAEKLVEVKNSTDGELPEWFTELEKDLGNVVSIKEEENGPTTPRATKVNRMLRKTLKEIQKFQRSKSGQKPELAAFRKTISSFMNVSHSIRVSDALYRPEEDETMPTKPAITPTPPTPPTPSTITTTQIVISHPSPITAVPPPAVVGNRVVVFAPRKFFDKDRRGVEV